MFPAGFVGGAEDVFDQRAKGSHAGGVEQAKFFQRGPQLRRDALQPLGSVRSFHSFGTVVTPVPRPRNPEAVVPKLKRDLDNFFAKKKRGRHTKIFPYVQSDSIMFLVRHGDPFERKAGIDDKGESVGVYYWPEKFDVLVLDTSDGELHIHARNKSEWEEYRTVFGRHLYGDRDFFSVDTKYTLESLQAIGEDSLAPIDGIDRVFLIEVYFSWDGDEGGLGSDKESHRSDDIFFAFKARHRQFPKDPLITKAKFRITLASAPPYVPPVRRVAFDTIQPQGHRVGVYGPGGIGKTTLASTAPGPVVFIDLDDSLPILKPSLGELDVRRVAGLTGWQDMRDALHSGGWDDIRTIVIDSATKAEEMALEWTLRNVRHEKDNVVIRRIEDYGFEHPSVIHADTFDVNRTYTLDAGTCLYPHAVPLANGKTCVCGPERTGNHPQAAERGHRRRPFAGRPVRASLS